MGKMKFHLFEVVCEDESRDFAVDFSRFNGILNMAEKERDLGNDVVILLEKGEIVPIPGGEVCLMDMMDARASGLPGRYTTKKENKDMPVEEGDRVSQQTMALYVPGKKHNYLVCQYNHQGVRAGKIADYFSGNGSPYWLEPVINDEVVNKLAKSKDITAFSVKVAAMEQGAASLDGYGVGGSLQEGKDFDAGVIDIKYSHGGGVRGGALNANRIKDLVSFWHKRMKAGGVDVMDNSREKTGILSMKATVRSQFDDKTEVLRIMKHLVVDEVDDDVLTKTGGGRFDYPSRKREIIASLNRFRKYMK